jgi:hypothetical protein
VPLNDIERKRCENVLSGYVARHRPPGHIRNQLDLGFRITDPSVELFEIRPEWEHPERFHEQPFAKATFVRSKGHWRVFRRRADLKWHRYPPAPEVPDIESFVALVERDEHHCFKG